jgi:hypothetical protein
MIVCRCIALASGLLAASLAVGGAVRATALSVGARF